MKAPARLAAMIDASLERHFWLWAGLFVTLFLACSIARDLRTPMWMDELYTLHTAQQPGLAAIVQATTDGYDFQPPLYAIQVHAILPIVHNDALAVRLPATLGYCGMALFLMGFCRHRYPAAYALAAAGLMCDVCIYYATEGRAYGLALCCAGCALVCWQAAASGVRRGLTIPLLGLSLAIMTALHYFSIFLLAPLLLGELVRWRRSGKPDFAIAAAAAVPALLVLGLHYPLTKGIQPFRVPSPHWDQIPPFYGNYFLPLLHVCPFAIAALALFPASRAGRNARAPGMPTHEWVAIGALALMPPIVIAVSRYTTHTFVDRYALWAVIGFAVLVAAMVNAASRRQAVVGVAVVGALLAQIALHEILFLRQAPALHDGETIRRELDILPDGPEPIVVANRRVFLELSYYGNSRVRGRIVCPLGWETSALGMAGLARHTSLRTMAYTALLEEHARFVLAGTPADPLFQRLAAAGYRATPIASAVYKVEAPQPR